MNACYTAILEAAQNLQLPTHYRDDLLVHDKNGCEILGDDVDRLWAVREHGSHLIPLTHDVNPVGIGWGPRPHALHVDCVLKWFEPAHWFLWRNGRLVAISAERAVRVAEIADDHVAQTARVERLAA